MPLYTQSSAGAITVCVPFRVAFSHVLSFQIPDRLLRVQRNRQADYPQHADGGEGSQHWLLHVLHLR